MGNFNRSKINRKRDHREDRKMFRAVCSDCGDDCEVPFKPSNDKPIYCNDCFDPEDRGYNDKGRGRDDRGRGRDDRGRPEMHKATCDDCGSRCEVPFRPSGDKPVYCNHCFDKGPKGGAGKPAKNDRSGEICEKLDKLISLLEKMHSGTEKVVLEKKVAAKEVVAKKTTTKKAPAKKVAAKKKAVVKKIVKKKAVSKKTAKKK